MLGIARIAGIMGAKRTPDLIPLCHSIALTRVTVDFRMDRGSCSVHCEATAETVGRTGVEMEALTAVQVALLTIYDMCKAVDRGMVMTGIKLVEKVGGKSGHWRRSKFDRPCCWPPHCRLLAFAPAWPCAVNADLSAPAIAPRPLYSRRMRPDGCASS